MIFKNLTQWLRANRISLNVDKTKLLILKSKYNKNQYQDMIIKLLGKRLEPSTSVKYLGIHIDHNLSWDCHIKEMNAKVNYIVFHYVPKKTMLSVLLCTILLSYGIWKSCVVFNNSNKS